MTNSFNRYSYVMNNPLKYTDPTGFYTHENAGKSYNERVNDANKTKPQHSGSDSSQNSTKNLERNYTFELSYVGRYISGIFGGVGNTPEDQIAMKTRTIKSLARAGAKIHQLKQLMSDLSETLSNNFNRYSPHFVKTMKSTYVRPGELSAFGFGVDINFHTYININREFGYYKSLVVNADGSLSYEKGFYTSKAVDTYGFDLGFHGAVYNSPNPKSFWDNGVEISGGNLFGVLSGSVVNPQLDNAFTSPADHVWGYEAGLGIPLGGHYGTTNTRKLFSWKPDNIWD